MIKKCTNCLIINFIENENESCYLCKKNSFLEDLPYKELENKMEKVYKIVDKASKRKSYDLFGNELVVVNDLCRSIKGVIEQR